MPTPKPTGTDGELANENATSGAALERTAHDSRPTLLWPAAYLLAILLLAAAYAFPPRQAFPNALDPAAGATQVMLWLALLILLTAFLFVVGWHYSGYWAGILVSRRNTFSLSQLQLVVWTLLVASAAFALFLIRLRTASDGAALAFEIPGEVPALLGVSTISFGATAAIHGAKKARTADPRDIERGKRAALKTKGGDYFAEWSNGRTKAPATAPMEILESAHGRMKGLALTSHLSTVTASANEKANLAGLSETEQTMRQETASFVQWMWSQMDREMDGVLYRNRKVTDARLRDIIEGDEITNANHLEMGKLQMLVFTLLAIVAYALLLYQMFAAGAADREGLPDISEGLVGILGASHLGYLGTKASAGTRSTLG